MTDELFKAREAIAAWMLANIYATGHGDTVEDLLGELDWQHRDRLLAATPDLVAAVKRALQFIENGLETRHVRMPDFVADPAHDTLPILRAALAKAEANHSA